ncbi:MAG: DUF4317 domain-containing protein [Lachnospiraceae bacterium]|nr:DUF4317 domain-containing protein [Lachnospiraceae bacterium]
MHQKGKINREDMLELTRRMTLSRTCFSRIAGAYFDEEGYVDGTFNRHFQKLTPAERQANLEIAKTIPFSETNAELKEYVFDADEERPGGIRQMLMALKACELKNDALLDTFYEFLGEMLGESQNKNVNSADSRMENRGNPVTWDALCRGWRPQGSFAFYIFYGTYDVPRKGTDHESQWESEEVYSFLIGAFCEVDEEYNPEPPTGGFLFPAFRDRCADDHRIEIFMKDC